MKVLVIGNGGREHAILWKMKQSGKVETLFIAPGNAGMENLATLVPLQVSQGKELAQFAKDQGVDLTIVGPEAPLVEGIVDIFKSEGLRVIGPHGEAAQLEGSKAFAKDFMTRHEIPTAAYEEFTDVDAAIAAVDRFGFPTVIKADGLAAGKGVIIAETKEDAITALKDMMVDKKFDDAGDKIVLEEFLTGIEASVLCFVDEDTIVPMESAQDYKRAYDGDMGLNTGGMGTYSPSLLFNDEIKNIVRDEILTPFHEGLKKDGLTYRGIIFIGIMIKNTDVKVIEFNVRFGDPETQSIMARLNTDLIDIFMAMSENKLKELDIQWSNQHAVCVMMASGGYPDAYEKGKAIIGITEDMLVFHSGTKRVGAELQTNGGRVLGVMGVADSLELARAKAYENVAKIQFEGAHFRTDIGTIVKSK
ncbi:MAG: phosphoribosylamine--glycine ligase [Clostridia bacterium]|nr:phosphoribosylamine--glycine ligase [Clostridia bacterium]